MDNIQKPTVQRERDGFKPITTWFDKRLCLIVKTASVFNIVHLFDTR
jgi:hypothetical protein